MVGKPTPRMIAYEMERLKKEGITAYRERIANLRLRIRTTTIEKGANKIIKRLKAAEWVETRYRIDEAKNGRTTNPS